MSPDGKVFFSIAFPFSTVCMAVGLFVFDLRGDALMATWLAPMSVVMISMMHRANVREARLDRRVPPPHRGS